MKKIKILTIFILNVFSIGIIKLRYRNRIMIKYKQLFLRFPKIRIQNNGTISLGKLMSNRGDCWIISDGGKLKIGDSCFLNSGCSITCLQDIQIGNGCTFANNVIIVDHDHDYRRNIGYRTSPIKIGNNVWVGANSVILRGCEIGDNCVIAAGTVVRKGIYSNNKLIKSNTKLDVRCID